MDFSTSNRSIRDHILRQLNDKIQEIVDDLDIDLDDHIDADEFVEEAIGDMSVEGQCYNCSASVDIDSVDINHGSIYISVSDCPRCQEPEGGDTFYAIKVGDHVVRKLYANESHASRVAQTSEKIRALAEALDTEITVAKFVMQEE